MAVLQEYKCPCCGGAIEFNVTAVKMKCPYCDSALTLVLLLATFLPISANNGTNDISEPFNFGLSIIISVVVGLIIAFISVSLMKGKLQSVASQSKADDYLKAGSLNITNSRDLFLYRTVTRIKKPTTQNTSKGRK